MSKEGNLPEPQSLHVIYELAIKRLDGQIAEIEGIDTKLRTNFWFASLVIGIPLTYLSFRQPQLTTALIIVISIIFVIYLLMLIFTWRSHAFAQPRYLVRIKDLQEKALFKHPSITQEVILNRVVEQIEANGKLITRKVSYARTAYWLVPFEVVSAGVILALLILN